MARQENAIGPNQTSAQTSPEMLVAQGNINIQVSTTGNRKSLKPIYILFEEEEYDVMDPVQGPLSQTYPVAEGSLKVKTEGSADAPVTVHVNYTSQ